MKIIQINGWLGQIFGPLARLVAEEKPDVVCVQEAFRPDPSIIPVFSLQFNYIERLQRAGDFAHMSFAPNWGFQIGDIVMDEGLCILSRHPLSDERSAHISGEYHVRRCAADSIDNTRNIQSCTVKLPTGAVVTVVNYHGHLAGPPGMGSDATIETLHKVRALLLNLPRPLIMCTDLNIWPSSPGMKILNDLDLRNLTIEHGITSTLSDAHKAPDADRAKVVTDYIYVSPEVRVDSFAVSEKIVSDHKALVLECGIASNR